MNYHIIAARADIGQIVVRYLDAQGDALADYPIDLPIVEGAYITGEALEAEIQSRAPTWLLERKQAVTTADFSGIAALVTVEPPASTPSDSLADAVTKAEDAIDAAAGKARSRFITVTVAQSTVYEIKAQQAQVFKDAGYAGTPPPYIAACAAATGKTAQETADEILTLRDLWVNQIDPLIESGRLGGKVRVKTAATVEEVGIRRADAIAYLNAFAPGQVLPPPLL